MIWENLKMAGRSIAGNKLRTFLTMLGIIIGVGAVVTISSIGEGLQKEVSKQVTDLGSNVVFVLPGQVISTNKSGGQSLNTASSIGTSTLTQKDIETVKNTEHVTNTTYMSLLTGVASHNGTQAPGALLIATTDTAPSVLQTIKIGTGRYFKKDELDANVAVIGSSVRDTLFGKGAKAENETIHVRNRDFKVIGVTKAADTGSSLGGPSLDDAIYLPVGAATSMVGSELSIYRVGAQIDDSKNVDATVSALKDKIRKNHGGTDDFSVLTQKDLLSTINTILSALTGAVAAIASIALLVGGIGIMNMMLVSVTERTREIGLRKAIGATSLMVLGQFLVEAIVLTVMGGALGVLVALAGGTAAGKLIKITAVFSPQTVITAFAISAGVGIIFGIAPAIKAARMRPIEALRYE